MGTKLAARAVEYLVQQMKVYQNDKKKIVGPESATLLGLRVSFFKNLNILKTDLGSKNLLYSSRGIGKRD